MTSKHTPTPWHLPSGWDTVGVALGEIPIFSSDEEVVAKCRAKENRRTLSDNIAANAAHIVKCVNLHDELVAGLMDAYPYIADDNLRASIGNLIDKARGEA